MLQLCPITQRTPTPAGSADGRGGGYSPPNLPVNPAAGRDKLMIPHRPEYSDTCHSLNKGSRALRAGNKHQFWIQSFLLWVSKLLTAVCGAHAAPQARLAPRRDGRSRVRLGRGAAGSRGDDSEGPWPAAESVLCSDLAPCSGVLSAISPLQKKFRAEIPNACGY